MPLHVSSICAHHMEVKIALHSLWYHHTYSSFTCLVTVVSEILLCIGTLIKAVNRCVTESQSIDTDSDVYRKIAGTERDVIL